MSRQANMEEFYNSVIFDELPTDFMKSTQADAKAADEASDYINPGDAAPVTRHVLKLKPAPSRIQ